MYLYDSIAYAPCTALLPVPPCSLYRPAPCTALLPALCSLLSAIRSDPFAISFTTPRDLCHPEFPLPASGLSAGQNGANPRESCQASQNEHLQKSSCNSREMNTCINQGRHEAWSNRRRRCKSRAFTLLC